MVDHRLVFDTNAKRCLTSRISTTKGASDHRGRKRVRVRERTRHDAGKNMDNRMDCVVDVMVTQ